MKLIALDRQVVGVLLQVQAVLHVVVYFVGQPLHAKGPIGVGADVIVVEMRVDNVPVNVDEVEDAVGRIGVCAPHFPDQAIGFRSVAAQITDFTVGDIHPRFQRHGLVGRKTGTHTDKGATELQVIGVGTVDGRVPGSDLGSVDFQRTIIGRYRDHAVGFAR